MVIVVGSDGGRDSGTGHGCDTGVCGDCVGHCVQDRGNG